MLFFERYVLPMVLYIEIYANWNMIDAKLEKIWYQLMLHFVNNLIAHVYPFWLKLFYFNEGVSTCDATRCPYGQCKRKPDGQTECACKQCSNDYSYRDLICGDNGITYSWVILRQKLTLRFFLLIRNWEH